MSGINKHNTERKTSKIENFFRLTYTPSQKRSSSSLSPSDQSQLLKKMNVEQKGDENSMIKETEDSQENIPGTPNTLLKQIIGPLIEEVKQLQNWTIK